MAWLTEIIFFHFSCGLDKHFPNNGDPLTTNFICSKETK